MQMEEKTMVADTLTGINGELVRFGEMIAQTENKELKQTLKQFRNACEQSQEELYQIAREKSYYVPAAKATQAEIDHVGCGRNAAALFCACSPQNVFPLVVVCCADRHTRRST